VLLTDAWLALDDHPEPFVLRLIFSYAEAHPPAPPAIHAIVDHVQVEPL
jgi:hypothetical protein